MPAPEIPSAADSSAWSVDSAVRRRPWRQWPVFEWAITLAAGILLLAALVWTPAGSAIGKRIYDRLSIWIGFEASPEVVLVAIDERSQRGLGGWPVSRVNYARLIERLVDQDQAPRALGLDLLFINALPVDADLAQQMARLPVVLPKVMSAASAPAAQAVPGTAGAAVWQWMPPTLEQAARATGHIHIRFESDGTLRGVQTQWMGQPHFALALLQAAGLVQTKGLPADDYLRFPMVDPAVGFKTYSLIDLLDAGKPLPDLKGKIVLLGVTDPILGDQHATIYSGTTATGTPGVAILASVVNAHLTGRWVRVVSDAWVFGWSAMALFLVISASAVWKPGRLRLLVYALGAGLPLAAVWALLGWGWWFDIVPLWLTVLVLTVVWIWRRLDGNLRYMYRKSRELQAVQPHRPRQRSAGDEVSRVEQALDQAIDLQGQQLNLLDQAIRHLPEAVAVIDPRGQVLRVNERMLALGAGRAVAPSTLEQLARELDLPFSHWDELTALAAQPDNSLRVSSPAGARDVYIKTSTFDASESQGLRLLTLVDVTELRQSQAQRDQALRFLSHDMRTPVASILAVTRQMRALAPDRPQWLSEVARVVGHADQLMRLMDGFLYESKAHSEQLALSERLIDDLIDDAMAQVRDLAQARGMQIEFRNHDRFFFVQVSTMLMVRVFMNLLLNAIKYGQPGSGVLISAEPAASGAQVDVVLSNQIASQGGAVDESIITNGFGLGLDFVRTVVQRHQGQLRIEIGHQPGLARVCVTLPCSMESA